jgi:hypothetical protein
MSRTLSPQQLLAANTVIEQGGEDGAIAHALERIDRRRVNQPARLGIAERRRQAFIAIRHWPLHAIDRIAGDGIGLTEVIEQCRQRRELAADGRRRQFAGFEMLAPGDHMSAADAAQFGEAAQAGESYKLSTSFL